MSKTANLPEENDSNEAVSSVRPLVRRSLAEQVVDELRNLILLEKLEPGATIPERETAEALGVSRTPLRESLRLLAAEGLIEIAPNRAPRVANPSLAELKDLLQVQGSLEALAGELASQNASDQQLQQIAALEQQMNSVSDTAEPLDFFKLDMAFHIAIVNASGNTALQETHATYNARLWRARFISSRQRVNREGMLEQHRAIVDALLSREGGNAAAALKSHLEIGYANIKKVRQGQSSPPAPVGTGDNK